MRPARSCWVVLALLFVMFSRPLNAAKKKTTDAATAASKAESSSPKLPLKATSNVGACISVEAVLLPWKPAAMLFGGWVADNYAVVKTTISNHCDDQQFILHNIYFDYSDWKLSGVYPELNIKPCPPTSPKPAAGDGSAPAPAANLSGGAQPSADQADQNQGGQADNAKELDQPCPTDGDEPAGCPPTANCRYTQNSLPGQVATVGALDVQDQLTEASVMSPRNVIVNSLALIGQVAQGFAFVWGSDVGTGVGAFNSGFVQNVEKYWTDRRINQEKNVLALGYRADQHTSIAKDDHGSYYAFFPLATFLMPNLTDVFLCDPAMFFNPAEVFLKIDKKAQCSNAGITNLMKRKNGNVEELQDVLRGLAQAVRQRLPRPSNAPADNTDDELDKSLLVDLAFPCPGQNCPYNFDSNVPEDKKTQAEKDNEAWYNRILFEKYLFAHASLNSVKIVARGVMTIDVNAVPPTIDAITCENEKETTTWTVATPAAGEKATPKEVSCTVAGKFLADSAPSVSKLEVDGKAATDTDYIDVKSLKVATGKASDTSLPFTFDLIKTLPSGSQITFQVTHETKNATDGTSTAKKSSPVAYKVSYTETTGTPKVDTLTIDKDDSGAWNEKGTINGAATGTDLTGTTTISVSELKIGGKSEPNVKAYIDNCADNAKKSSATTIKFDCDLLQKIDPQSVVTFSIKIESGGKTHTFDKEHTVPAAKAAAKPAAAKKAVAAAKKPAAKPTAKPAAEKKPGE